MNLKKLLIANLVLFVTGLLLAGFTFTYASQPLSKVKIDRVEKNLANSKDVEFLRKSAFSLHSLVLKNVEGTRFITTFFSISLIALSLGFSINAGYIFLFLKQKE